MVDLNSPSCPCCKQGLETTEKQSVYSKQGRLLAANDSPLLASSVQATETSKAAFQAWRKTVDEHSTDLHTFSLLETKIQTCESENQGLDDEVNSLKSVVAQLKDEVEDLKAEVVDLEELAKASDRWKDSSLRIGQKAMTIQGKRKDLSILSHSSSAFVRDRRTVDREYADITEELDRLSNKKTALNGEATKLNQLISQTAQQVSAMSDVVSVKR